VGRGDGNVFEDFDGLDSQLEDPRRRVLVGSKFGSEELCRRGKT
jgi:hypothetical protein